MSSDEAGALARLREAAQDLAVGSGQRLLGQWRDLKVDPMIACIALIRMAYTLAPSSVTAAADGPEQFAQLCKLVAQKDGVLEERSKLGDAKAAL